MQTSPAVRRFAFRLRLRARLSTFLRGFDGSDVLTIAALALIGAGVALLSVAAALVVVGALVALLTPIGTSIRIFVRGK